MGKEYGSGRKTVEDRSLEIKAKAEASNNPIKLDNMKRSE
jgi:hypothetical protein